MWYWIDCPGLQLEGLISTTETQTNFANFLTNSNAKLRQMGAVRLTFSKPVLITQSGTTTYNDKTW